MMFLSVLLVCFLTPTSLSLTTASGTIQTAQSTASLGSGSFTVTLSSKPTSGNTLFLTYAGTGQTANPTISNVNQNGVTWAKAVSKNGLVDVEIWYGTVGANAGNTATITVTGGSTTQVGNIADICEWANIVTTNPLDKTAFNTGLSVEGDTGTTAVTSQSNELFIGVIGTTGVTDQLSRNDGYVLSNGQAKNLGTYLSIAEVVKISTTKEEANSGTNFMKTSWAGCIATFKSQDISPTPTPTTSHTPTPTPTLTPTPTPTTATPTSNFSPTYAPTPIPSPSPILTSNPTASPEPTQITTPSNTPTNTPVSNQPISPPSLGYLLILAIWTTNAIAFVIMLLLLYSSRRSSK